MKVASSASRARHAPTADPAAPVARAIATPLPGSILSVIAASCLTAVLLVIAFPGWSRPWAAWIAWTPWLWTLPTLSRPRAVWSAAAIGFAFFLGSIAWLHHVTTIGLIILSAYLALFVGLFGVLAHTIVHQPAVDGAELRSDARWLLGVPSAWVLTEFLRSRLLSGFGWNLLGYSQTPWLPAIQVADLAGVWGVSWVLLLSSALVARRRRFSIASVAAAGLIAGALGYGAWRLRLTPPTGAARVAVLQGNIPQNQKWDAAYEASIVQTYNRLTHRAAQIDPDVVVWPETSVPGFFGMEEPVTRPVLQLAKEVGRPLLVGAPMGHLRKVTWELTNSAALVTPDGAIAARYDKIHLVPFGEFVPGERVFPWLRDMLPPIGEFRPGQAHTVFQVPPEPGRATVPAFGVLVCFEDAFPELAREHVRRGARWLATITNDAWFGKSAAAIQHAQASTLRAVELRVPMVRAANTGWSGCIDDRGRWTEQVQQAGQPLFVEGLATCDLQLHDEHTLYRAWGDWWPLVCFGLVGAALWRRHAPGAQV